MKTTNDTHALEEMIHEKNLTSGEIWTIKDLACDIERLERDNGITFTDAEILTAWRAAGESFVDSMQGNTSDGYNYEGRHRETETEYQEELDRWEAMRPSVVRRKQIAEIGQPPAPTQKTTFKSVPVGSAFYFPHNPREMDIAQVGQCVKLTSRTYRTDSGMVCRVGSLSVIVTK